MEKSAAEIVAAETESINMDSKHGNDDCPQSDVKSMEQLEEKVQQINVTKMDTKQIEAELLQAVLSQQAAAAQSTAAVASEAENTKLPATETPPSATKYAEAVETAEMAREATTSHEECAASLQAQRLQYEQQLEQMRVALSQKENMILLFQRENTILEKEKQAFRKEKELANTEKETTVIKFAMQEKSLIDAKKAKETVEKQLADARKEIKNVSLRFQAVNEEKSRMSYIIDEKCNEVRKYQRECEKLKSDYGHLESKLKYHVNKLNMEMEAKTALEKKLEEERNAPSKLEEKANEKLKIEFDANAILLKHEIERKTEIVETLTKEQQRCTEMLKQLQEQLNNEVTQKDELALQLQQLQDEHETVQNAYSTEMLSAAKLRVQLEELQMLKTQNTLNEEKIMLLNAEKQELQDMLRENATDLSLTQIRANELLCINKEMSEASVQLQNQICLLTGKVQGIEAENALISKEKAAFDEKYEALAEKLKAEIAQKNEERQLLTKHLSEKTKLYEMNKVKLENVLGDFEAAKHKNATFVRELQRELQKYKKQMEQMMNATQNGNSEESSVASADLATPRPTHSRGSSISGKSSSRRNSECSELEAAASNATALPSEQKSVSKQQLIERILRLQQASARQTEKMDFLENHNLALVNELQKKSKLVQYYMLRDQTGALTSSLSDQNKSELSKYGNGVMSAIYNGIKGQENKSMTLDLSLEINKKLQAVLEDTLLKNITLKDNLDVLGLEVDNLTRQLRQIERKE